MTRPAYLLALAFLLVWVPLVRAKDSLEKGTQTLSAREAALAALEKALDKGKGKGEITFELGQVAAVERIRFRCTQCTPELLAHLGKLTELRELSLRLDSSMTAGDLAPLKQLTNLESLTLHHTGLADECLAAVKDLPKLKHIELARVQGFTGEGLGHLSAERLESLRIAGVRISDESLTQIGKLKGLKELSLVSLTIEGPIDERLKGLANLRSLCVLQSKIERGSVAELRKALPELKMVP